MFRVPSLLVLSSNRLTRYVREITVTNNESNSLLKHPVRVILEGVHPPSSMVFTDRGAVLPHWIRRQCPTFTEVYVAVDLEPNQTKDLYLWYGGYVWDSDYPFQPSEVNCFSFDFRSPTNLTQFWDVIGTWDIQNDVLHGTSDGWFQMYVKDLELLDVFAEFSIKAPNGWCVFQMRSPDSNNRYWFGHCGGSSFGLRKQVDGSWSNVSTYVASTGVWRHFRVKMVGSDFEMWEMDRGSNYRAYVSKINGSDSDISATTKVGLLGQEIYDHYHSSFFVRKATATEPSVSIGPEKKSVRKW